MNQLGVILLELRPETYLYIYICVCVCVCVCGQDIMKDGFSTTGELGENAVMWMRKEDSAFLFVP